jgi:3alpha(or 20beta)-hydroxysteroid dehydrogenase
VVLADIDEKECLVVASGIVHDGGIASSVKLDAGSPESWLNVEGHIRTSYGRLDVLVNNAGVISREGVQDVSIEDWHRVIQINLTGPMLGIRTLAPLIRDSGGGAIVNVSSTAGLIGHPGAAYCASKWGLRGVTKSAALTLLDWKIRVNSVHPAQVTNTQITADATPAWRYANERVMPAKRPSNPDEVCNAILFLASDASSYVNASEVVVDGGATSIGLANLRTRLQDEHERQSQS